MCEMAFATASNGIADGGFSISDRIPSGIESLPVEVLERIFQFVDPTGLLRLCAPVCRQWHSVLRTQGAFWHTYCTTRWWMELQHAPPGTEWARMAVYHPFRRNLAGERGIVEDVRLWRADPCVTTEWQYGQGWTIEENRPLLQLDAAAAAPGELVPYGRMQPQPTPFATPGASHSCANMSNLAANHSWCHLARCLPLSRMGVPTGMTVAVEVAVEVLVRHDCGGRLRIRGAVDGTAGEIFPAAEQDMRWNAGELLNWTWVRARSKGFLVAADSNLEVSVSACDTNFWAGHYGTKIRRIHLTLTVDPLPLPPALSQLT